MLPLLPVWLAAGLPFSCPKGNVSAALLPRRLPQQAQSKSWFSPPPPPQQLALPFPQVDSTWFVLLFRQAIPPEACGRRRHPHLCHGCGSLQVRKCREGWGTSRTRGLVERGICPLTSKPPRCCASGPVSRGGGGASEVASHGAGEACLSPWPARLPAWPWPTWELCLEVLCFLGSAVGSRHTTLQTPGSPISERVSQQDFQHVGPGTYLPPTFQAFICVHLLNPRDAANPLGHIVAVKAGEAGAPPLAHSAPAKGLRLCQGQAGPSTRLSLGFRRSSTFLSLQGQPGSVCEAVHSAAREAFVPDMVPAGRRSRLPGQLCPLEYMPTCRQTLAGL